MAAVNLGERQLKKIRVLTRLGMVMKKMIFPPADGELMEF
jgi:hypothetical protein